MKAFVTLSAKFDRAPDGRVFPRNPALTYERFFQRYLEVFEEVLVAARVGSLQGEPVCPHPSSGPGVSFVDMPVYSGIADLVFAWPEIRRQLSEAIKESDSYFLRVPDFLGTLAWMELKRSGLPYAVEVVGDPADSLQAGSIKHPLRPFIRWLAIRHLRAQCAGASAAAYVTEHTLQRRYPPGSQAFITHYSSIDLPREWFTQEPRHFWRPAERLVFVGSLEVMYKAPDVLLKALKILSDRGIRLNLDIVGDGRCRPQLEATVQGLGLDGQVVFRGKVPYNEILGHLDAADLFVLPSRTEGLPKAMIEAMARGLPCIGSTAGGIPELLPPEDLVPPGDALNLANKIMEVVGDPERLSRMSARNLAEAKKYRVDVLGVKRRDFYRHVLEITKKYRRE